MTKQYHETQMLKLVKFLYTLAFGKQPTEERAQELLEQFKEQES